MSLERTIGCNLDYNLSVAVILCLYKKSLFKIDTTDDSSTSDVFATDSVTSTDYETTTEAMPEELQFEVSTWCRTYRY